jgi:hypothetical protein
LYKENAYLNFPGAKTPLLAGDLWRKDEKKKKYAEANGYCYLHIWEQDINSASNDALDEMLLDLLSQQLELHHLG